MEDLNQLKLVLVKKKKTNKWLAEQLNVNQTTVSKWCTNTSQPDLATLKRISELLNANVSEIIIYRLILRQLICQYGSRNCFISDSSH